MFVFGEMLQYAYATIPIASIVNTSRLVLTDFELKLYQKQFDDKSLAIDKKSITTDMKSI